MKQKRHQLVNGEKRIADFSECENYRYSLFIRWSESEPLATFIGLNPSTADEQKDDNTLRRCKGFALRFGYGGMIMVNLFAWRDTDRSVLRRLKNPIGEDGTCFSPCGRRFQNYNDLAIFNAVRQAGITIAAWGNDGRILYRAAKVKIMLRDFGQSLHCLKITAGGNPQHPLYLKSDLKPIPLP